MNKKQVKKNFFPNMKVLNKTWYSIKKEEQGMPVFCVLINLVTKFFLTHILGHEKEYTYKNKFYRPWAHKSRFWKGKNK